MRKIIRKEYTKVKYAKYAKNTQNTQKTRSFSLLSIFLQKYAGYEKSAKCIKSGNKKIHTQNVHSPLADGDAAATAPTRRQ